MNVKELRDFLSRFSEAMPVMVECDCASASTSHTLVEEIEEVFLNEDDRPIVVISMRGSH